MTAAVEGSGCGQAFVMETVTVQGGCPPRAASGVLSPAHRRLLPSEYLVPWHTLGPLGHFDVTRKRSL